MLNKAFIIDWNNHNKSIKTNDTNVNFSKEVIYGRLIFSVIKEILPALSAQQFLSLLLSHDFFHTTDEALY